MAVHMFLKLHGIKGESLDAHHPDEIEILSWNWGMHQDGNFHVGSGGGAGKVAVHDINISKYVDFATPTLQQFCCTGKHIESGKLTCRKASGEKSIPYLQLDLKGILINRHAISGVGDKDRISESITLHFRQFKTIYLIQEKGGISKPGPECAFNMATMQPI